MLYWNNGIPSTATSTETRGTKYWHDGVPALETIIATSTNPIKKIGGIIWASAKKINMVVLANIKKLSGVTT